MKNTRAFTQSDFKRITTVARPVITSILKKINLSQEDEDDVMSETLIKIVRYWDRYDESVSKDAWFKKIAANCANTYLRKAYKYIENRQSIDKITNDGESYEIDYQSLAVDGQQYCTYADLSLYSKERMSYIKRAVGSLNDKERQIIEMDLHGYSAEEIQATLGISNANLRTIKSRGRAKLLQDAAIREMMKEYFGMVG